MTETLREISRSDPFAAAREFDSAARFHVWHSRLGIAKAPDTSVVEALARGRGIAVVGPPGSGKTSTLAAAALGTDGFAASHVPLTLSVSGREVVARAHDPRYLTERLVRAVARVHAEATELVDDAAPTGTATRAASTWKAQVGPSFATFGRELRQRTQAVDFERAPADVLDAARAALALVRDAQIRTAILLEDADGLLRLADRTPEQRRDIAETFFSDGLAPMVKELDVPVLLAVQPEYLDLDGFRTLAGLLDDSVTAPSPKRFDDGGVELLLAESLATARLKRSVRSLFTDEALAVLTHNRYSLDTIRELLQTCDRSIKHAMTERRTVVDEPDVAYALSQR